MRPHGQAAIDSVDAAIREAASITHRCHRDVRPVGPWHWSWRLLDQAVSPHRELAVGWALTQRRAYRQAKQACRALGRAS